MHFMALRNLKISSATILCSLMGLAFSASLFGLDFSASDMDVTTGYYRMSQNINRQNNNQLKSNSNYGSIGPFSSNDNFYQPNFRTPMRPTPTPIDFMDSFKLESELPLNQSMHHENHNRGIDTLVKKDSRKEGGSLHNKDDFGNSNPTEQTNQKTGISEEADDDKDTLEWSDFHTDYTTETSDYETTTEELGRIGNPAPAVVASLLG